MHKDGAHYMFPAERFNKQYIQAAHRSLSVASNFIFAAQPGETFLILRKVGVMIQKSCLKFLNLSRTIFCDSALLNQHISILDMIYTANKTKYILF